MYTKSKTTQEAAGRPCSERVLDPGRMHRPTYGLTWTDTFLEIAEEWVHTVLGDGHGAGRPHSEYVSDLGRTDASIV